MSNTEPPAAVPPGEAGGPEKARPRSDPRAKGDRFRTWVTLLIAAVSIIGAVVAWRASVLAWDSAGRAQEGLIQLTLQQQKLAEINGGIAQDFRVFVRFQEAVMAYRTLLRQARQVRAQDPTLARELETRAKTHLAVARNLNALFHRSTADFGDPSGNVEYDPGGNVEFLRSTDLELAGLSPRESLEEAASGHGRVVQLVGIIALLAGALFLLTLGRLTGKSVRGVFAGAGAATAGVGLVLFALVEATAR